MASRSALLLDQFRHRRIIQPLRADRLGWLVFANYGA